MIQQFQCLVEACVILLFPVGVVGCPTTHDVREKSWIGVSCGKCCVVVTGRSVVGSHSVRLTTFTSFMYLVSVSSEEVPTVPA